MSCRIWYNLIQGICRNGKTKFAICRCWYHTLKKRNTEIEVHNEGERDQKGTQNITASTNRDSVSAITQCGEPSNIRVGPRDPITDATLTKKPNEIHHLKCYVINADSLPSKLINFTQGSNMMSTLTL